ncbi:MAG: hypothetical protein ACK5BR_03245 [Bacteroidota bacterium]|jgi:hypothetical protein
MKCPTCKNPIEGRSAVCEWCGNSIHLNKEFEGIGDYPFSIHFFFEKTSRAPFPKHLSVMIFVDKVMVHEFNANFGCDFYFNLVNKNPTIEVSLDKGVKKHLVEVSPNYFNDDWKKLRISWKQNWLGVVRFDKPIVFPIN